MRTFRFGIARSFIFTAIALLVVVSLGAANAWAASEAYSLSMTGDQIVPGPGDPDGLGTGTISLDDVTGLISWNFSLSNLDSPTAMHIHGPGGSAGSAAAPFIGLGVSTSGGAGTLIDDLTLAAVDLPLATQVLADPTDFYVQIHTTSFTPGAVRGQLGTIVPEPGSLALISIAMLAVLAGSKRRRS